jgi:hypothetical protein
MAVDKLVDSAQLNTDLTAVANAIRAKSGGSTPLAFPGGFVSEIGSIQTGGGGEWTTNGLADNSEPNGALVYTGTAAITTYAFYGRSAVTSFSAPNLVNAIKNSAFGYATRLASVSFPKVKSIQKEAFTNCTALTSVDMPLFEGFTEESVFYNCSNLVEIRLPNCNRLNDRTFQGCRKLKRVILNTNSRAPSTSAFGTYCFYGTVLDTLVLGGTDDALWKLGNVNAFDNTPFKSGGTGGTIYIPEALYNKLGDGSSLDYQSATNWSTLHSRGTVTWAKIEGSIYE